MRTKVSKTPSQIAISADSGEPLGGMFLVLSSHCTHPLTLHDRCILLLEAYMTER